MNADSQMHTAPSISGQTIELGAGHLVAIYVRNGVCRVAEFRDGRVELMYAGEWFRFHAGGLRYCHNRRAAALESAKPLTMAMIDRIERLHRASEARDEKLRAAQTSTAVVRGYWISVMSLLRVRESKIGGTPN